MEITHEGFIQTARKNGLNLDETTIVLANIGLDFQVALGTDIKGNQWVLRIPRRKDAFLKTKSEKKILNKLASSDLPFEVPNWEFYSEDLIAYQSVAGDPAVTTDADTQENHWIFDENNAPSSYIQSLGQVLAALHAVADSSEINSGKISNIFREDMKLRMDKVNKQYEVNESLWLRWQKWIEDESMWPQKAGFIHGDMYPGHTLVNEHFDVVGMIDWTEAKIGDISNDFTAFYMLFGEKALEKLINAYKNSGGYTWPKMKEHIIELLSTQAITLAEFGESAGLDEYKEIAKEMFKQGN